MLKGRRDGSELQAGDALGPFKVEELLGEGGMGRVYRAVRETDGETVALKVIKRRLAADEALRRRFLHEARAAAEVDHKHLIGVLDAGESEGQVWMAMPFCPGRSLEQRIRDGGKLGVTDTLRVVAEVGSGLDALHQRQLVHRDVKSSNIMLTESGSAALTDFGLAKGSDYTALTAPGQVVGTLDYLAPEMIRGEPAGPASDIYALGCVAFECLAGDPPFAGKSMFEVGMAILDEDPPDPCAQRPDLPPAFGNAVLVALAKDPANRPPTATAYSRMLHVAAG